MLSLKAVAFFSRKDKGTISIIFSFALFAPLRLKDFCGYKPPFFYFTGKPWAWYYYQIKRRIF